MNKALLLAAGLVCCLGLFGACGDRASREEFRHDLQVRLDQVDAKLSQLEDKAKQATEDARPRWNAMVADLKAKRARADEKLRDISNATDDSWQRFKGEARSAIDDLGDAVEKGWHELVK